MYTTLLLTEPFTMWTGRARDRTTDSLGSGQPSRTLRHSRSCNMISLFTNFQNNKPKAFQTVKFPCSWSDCRFLLPHMIHHHHLCGSDISTSADKQIPPLKQHGNCSCCHSSIAEPVSQRCRLRFICKSFVPLSQRQPRRGQADGEASLPPPHPPSPSTCMGTRPRGPCVGWRLRWRCAGEGRGGVVVCLSVARWC